MGLMRIAINTLAAQGKFYGGARYIRNLVRGLAKIDGDNEYILYTSPSEVVYYRDLGPNFQLTFRDSNRFMRILWEQTRLPWDLARRQVDVFHGTGFVSPLHKTCQQVTTVFDMTFFSLPEKHTLMKRAYFTRLIPASLARSDKVIVISESTREDVVRILGISPRKIKVTYPGKDERFKPIDNANGLNEVRSKYGLPERKVILFVGVIEPRKNLVTLLRAFEKLKDLHCEYCLVIAGATGWNYQDVFAEEAKLGLKEHLFFPGFIADEDLPLLYNLAEVFVYPSVYEGFGLPVLEAMACGVPVITSNVSSMPEVVGDVGLLVEPTNVEQLAQALARVLRDSSLRQRMRDNGLERSRLFSWEKMARETLAAYQEVAG